MPLKILRHMFFTLLMWSAQATFVMAQDQTDCPKSPNLLIASCNNPLIVKLRVLPDRVEPASTHLLTIAGTYSSGDRYGIEGLVIKGGEIISHRYQNWDGVLIIDADGVPSIFHATDVVVNNGHYNLKEKLSREEFIKTALEDRLTVMQSHLLIAKGELDLEDIDGAPQFKRRLLVTFPDGNFAVWETDGSDTLFGAAQKLYQDLKPEMALNLDMGAYDFCQLGPIDVQIDCGSLLVSEEKLTNLLEFSNL